jgi:hypothetical protein
MPIKRLPRPRIQRAFVRWFNQNHTRFEVPIRLTKITAKGVELIFQDYPDCLSIWLSGDELAVHVNWQGHWWDMIIDLDVWIYHTPDGYKCRCCWDHSGESASIFPSREALWQDHLFDPFLKWVNEKLAPARWLQISGTGNRGSTWAQLIRDESELDKPDRALILLQELKRLDGTPAYDGGAEGITNCLVELS